MNFEFDETQQLIVKTAKAFAEKEILPLAEKIDKECYFPENIFAKLAQVGFLGVNISPEYGGVGADILSAVLIVEQLARGSASVGLSYGAHDNLCAYNIYKNANETQKKQYLPDLCAGKKIGALGLTEPDAGSDAVNIKTTAVKKGDKYILNGTKRFITNAPIADIVLIYAKTEPSMGARGISAFIVDRNFKGFFTPNKLDKMGHRGSPTGDVVLEDCEVPEENLLGKENEGIRIMMNGLDVERAFFAGGAIGTAQVAFELALKYSKERIQFGKPIAEFQLIQAKLADMYTQIESSKLLCYKAALLADKSQRGGKGSELHRIAAAAILMAAEVCQKVCDQALQIHGGYGYTTEYPINCLYRDSRLMTIGAGTSEIRRLIIARELLEM